MSATGFKNFIHEILKNKNKCNAYVNFILNVLCCLHVVLPVISFSDHFFYCVHMFNFWLYIVLF